MMSLPGMGGPLSAGPGPIQGMPQPDTGMTTQPPQSPQYITSAPQGTAVPQPGPGKGGPITMGGPIGFGAMQDPNAPQLDANGYPIVAPGDVAGSWSQGQAAGFNPLTQGITR